MTSAPATLLQISPFDILVHAFGEYRRALGRRITVGLGTAAAACVAAGLITMAAGGVVSSVASVNAHFRPRGSIGLVTVARANPHPVWGGTAERAGPVRALADPAVAPAADEASSGTADLTSAAIIAAPLFSDDDSDIADGAPSAAEGLFDETFTLRPTPELLPAGYAALRFAALTPEIPAAAPRRPSSTELNHQIPIFLPDPDSRTAVYDIKAQTVYLPNGQKLEAHSGLGKRRDDPSYVADKGRGPTPPNVYRLTMRERPFHGVRALRLNPVPGSTMYGRDGILAHTYMRGGLGQSRGCVTFKNYPAFLKAFLEGEIDRIVVVPELGTKVSAAALARPDASEQ